MPGLLHKLFEDAREGGYLALNRLSRSRRALRSPPGVVTAVSTGMRLGELLALLWGDIDWDAKTGDQLVATLQSLRRARFGETPAAGILVFTMPDGPQIDPDNPVEAPLTCTNGAGNGAGGSADKPRRRRTDAAIVDDLRP